MSPEDALGQSQRKSISTKIKTKQNHRNNENRSLRYVKFSLTPYTLNGTARPSQHTVPETLPLFRINHTRAGNLSHTTSRQPPNLRLAFTRSFCTLETINAWDLMPLADLIKHKHASGETTPPPVHPNTKYITTIQNAHTTDKNDHR